MATTLQGQMVTQGSGPALIDRADVGRLVGWNNSGAGPLVAKAGGGIAGATQITARYSTFGTVATANDSALLPPALSGEYRVIENAGAAALRLYCSGSNPNLNPVAADVIVPAAGGASVTFIAVPANGTAVVFCSIPGRWKSLNQ